METTHSHDSGGALASPITHVSISLAVEATEVECASVGEQMGGMCMSAGEALLVSNERLQRLLRDGVNGLPTYANTPAHWAHEVEITLKNIRNLLNTPSNRPV